MISPRLAWSTILRATSDMEVAIRVKSDPLNPSAVASARPSRRAVTMSAAVLIATRVSLCMFQGPLGQPVKIRQPFFKVEGCPDAFQRQPQLHHGKRDVRLDADDHRFCSP